MPARALAAACFFLLASLPESPRRAAATTGVSSSTDLETDGGPVSNEPLVPPPCPLDAEHLGAPVRRLTADDARAVGDAYADSNVARITQIDSMLRAGDFGPPRSPDARRKAHLMARLVTLNAYSYMIAFASDRQHITETDEAALKPAFETFSDPGVYPIARLQRARMGLGHMCAHYDLSQKMRTETMLGGQRLSVRVDDVPIQGKMQRVLIMDLPTGLFDVVEVWMAPHLTMDVVGGRSAGPPGPYEYYVIERIRGLWVHKFGVHRPEAFAYWVSPRHPMPSTLPKRPLVGARIYVPHIRLKLPSILPDINFEDLREVDLPQPILELAYLREKRYPEWLKPAKLRGFRDWKGVGPVPQDLRRRFPDL